MQRSSGNEGKPDDMVFLVSTVMAEKQSFLEENTGDGYSEIIKFTNDSIDWVMRVSETQEAPKYTSRLL